MSEFEYRVRDRIIKHRETVGMVFVILSAGGHTYFWFNSNLNIKVSSLLFLLATTGLVLSKALPDLAYDSSWQAQLFLSVAAVVAAALLIGSDNPNLAPKSDLFRQFGLLVFASIIGLLIKLVVFDWTTSHYLPDLAGHFVYLAGLMAGIFYSSVERVLLVLFVFLLLIMFVLFILYSHMLKDLLNLFRYMTYRMLPNLEDPIERQIIDMFQNIEPNTATEEDIFEKIDKPEDEISEKLKTLVNTGYLNLHATTGCLRIYSRSNKRFWFQRIRSFITSIGVRLRRGTSRRQ